MNNHRLSFPEEKKDCVSLTGKYFTLSDGNKLFVRRAGPKDSDRLLIFLHGFNLSGAVWSCIQVYLAKLGYYVFAPDLPGQGYSSNFNLPVLPPQTTGVAPLFDLYANYIFELVIAKAKHRKITLIGNSLGGAVAQVYALKYGIGLENLILIGTSPRFQPDIATGWIPPKFSANPNIVPIFFALVLGDEATRRAILEASVQTNFPYTTFTPKQQQTYVTQYLQMLSELNQGIAVQEIFALAAQDIRSVVKNIKTRTLIINGGVLRQTALGIVGDSIAPWGASQFLNEQITTSTLVIFDNLDHTPQISDYPRVEKYIETFLETNKPITPCLPMSGVVINFNSSSC